MQTPTLPIHMFIFMRMVQIAESKRGSGCYMTQEQVQAGAAAVAEMASHGFRFGDPDNESSAYHVLPCGDTKKHVRRGFPACQGYAMLMDVFSQTINKE